MTRREGESRYAFSRRCRKIKKLKGMIENNEIKIARSSAQADAIDSIINRLSSIPSSYVDDMIKFRTEAARLTAANKIYATGIRELEGE